MDDIKYDKPFKGRTYNLFGGEAVSDGYFETIANMIKILLNEFRNADELLKIIRKESQSKYHLRKVTGVKVIEDNIILRLISEYSLAKYTTEVSSHLSALSFRKRISDPTLSMRERQHHLYMLEIGLVNLINIKEFKRRAFKVALLPHCLRDIYEDCASAPDDIDYACQGCREYCYIHLISDLLKKHQVSPYIWSSMNLKKMLKKLYQRYGEIGILGIACIPELVRGMNICLDKGVAVVGIPLNANRCARWMGNYYPNSVNLNMLDALLS